MYGVGQSSPGGRGWLVIVGVMVLALVLGGLFFAFYTLVLKRDNGTPTPEAAATVVQFVSPIGDTAAPPTEAPPTEAPPTEVATSTTPPTIPPTYTPLPTPTLRPPPEVITIGVRARVSINADGLNLREQPSINAKAITQLVDGDEVDVVKGPEVVENWRWWNVNGGEGQVGWVVDGYGDETWLVPVDWTDQATPLPTPSPVVTPTATSALAPTVAPPTATPVVTPTATVTPTLAPTATPEITPTATPEITPTATPVLTPTVTPEGGIPSPTVGGRAQVTTQYQFINLRAEPGLSTEIIGQLQNGTIVTILEGPEEVEGLRWWKVDDGQGNIGWAAERVFEDVLLVPVP